MDEKNEEGRSAAPKKNLPLEIWIASGTGLLASLFPWVIYNRNISDLPGFRFTFFRLADNGWNASLFGVPSALAVLALVAVGVFAWLKLEKKWIAPPQLNLGLSIFGGAFPLLLIIVSFGRHGENGAFGAYLAAAAGGYLTYLFVMKREALFLTNVGTSDAPSKQAEEGEKSEPVKEEEDADSKE